MPLSLDRQNAYRARYARQHPEWRPATEQYEALIRAHLHPGLRVLDLGCGRGGVLEQLGAAVDRPLGLDPDLASLAGHRLPDLPRAVALADALPLPAGSVDLEAAYAVEPDLIIVAATGGDSALPQRAEFQQVAPTIVLDYGSQTWQELAVQIGEATGLEAQVAAKIADFDAQVAAAAAAITVPAGTANIISYNGAGTENPIGRVGGPHAELLEALGFVIEDPPVEWHSQANTRSDFVWAAFERLPELTSETTFLLRFGDDQVGPFVDEPVLANLPSVKAGQVYGLGVNSFRIDYFSALEIAAQIVDTFGN